MLEDARRKKPPDKPTIETIENTEKPTEEIIESTEPKVRPYGPKVQTVEIESQNKEEKPKIFIQSKSMPGPMKEYKNLTNGEHMVKIEKELSKGIDPCEKGMECKQDVEIRKPEENPEENEKGIEEKELNWKHEDLVPEAPDPISIPDINSIPRIPHDLPKTNNMEQMDKLKDQKKENEKEEVKELQEQMKQLKLLEAQGKTYDPEEHLRQRPKVPGKNPVDVRRIVQLLKLSLIHI